MVKTEEEQEIDTTVSVSLTADSTKNQQEERNDSLLLDEWLSHDSFDFHLFSPEEATEIRQRLLDWYDAHRRHLPWRGDPPPWDGSTANFADKTKKKKNSSEEKPMGKRSSAQQSSIQDYFAPTTNNNKKKKRASTSSPQSVSQTETDTTTTAFPVSAYGIWVSEIMLQQTRVEAVIPYWVRWMHSFPTIQELAAATDEQINAHWAGLGFYRRGRLLHQAAQYVVQTLDGQLPTTVEGLLQLPGVGRYTASAIASIAYQVTVPVVDGNVCRVLARLRGIAIDVKAPMLKDKLGWNLAQQLVEAGDQSRPGHVNQALMELGATYCAPSGTGIDPQDPLVDHYVSTRLGLEVARRWQSNNTQTLSASIQGGCALCGDSGQARALETIITLLQQQQQRELPANGDNEEWRDFARTCGHKTFPLAPPKQAKRQEILAVAALCRTTTTTTTITKTRTTNPQTTNEPKWLLTRRPSQGLLAGQWEFPAALLWSSSNNTNQTKSSNNKKKKKDDGENQTLPPKIPVQTRNRSLDERLNDLQQQQQSEERAERTESWSAWSRTCLKDPMDHVFSHVVHTMWVEYAHVEEPIDDDNDDDDDDDKSSSSTATTTRWMTESEMKAVGVTAGVQKILNQVRRSQAPSRGKPTRTTTTTTQKGGNNKSIKRRRTTS